MSGLQDYIISNLERTGYPNGEPPQYPVCPVCGEECNEVYTYTNNEIIGCDCCVNIRDAWECVECFPGKEEQL